MGIKEVARQAGVSVATVSYYINGTKNVSPQSFEIFQRVFLVIRIAAVSGRTWTAYQRELNDSGVGAGHYQRIL